MYFLDTGLAAYLCRWSNAQTLENCAKVPTNPDKNFGVLLIHE